MSAPPKKSFKIKVLPKKEGPTPIQSRSAKKSSEKSHTDWTANGLKVFLLLIGVLALGGLYLINSQDPAKTNAVADPTGLQSPADKKLTQYLQDGQKKAELQSLKVQVENQRAAISTEDLPAFLPLEGESIDRRRNFGVELESDQSMDRIYDELYGASPGGKWMSPEERISARLAEKKWLYNYEKEEKKMYIRNFIEAARQAGYEVQINEDLIVTHVRPITSKPKIPLDKVLENLQFSR